MSPFGCVITTAVAYVGFILFIARMMSEKWHPDRGRHDYT